MFRTSLTARSLISLFLSVFRLKSIQDELLEGFLSEKNCAIFVIVQSQLIYPTRLSIGKYYRILESYITGVLIKDANEVSANNLKHNIALQRFQKIAIFIEDNNGSDFSWSKLIVYAFRDPSWIILFQNYYNLRVIFFEPLTVVFEGF